MEQITSWKTNKFLASQEISHTLRNPNVHYRIYNNPAPVPFLNQIKPVHDPHPISWRLILILSSHLRLDLLSGLFLSGFLIKILSQYVTHAPPISFASMYSP